MDASTSNLCIGLAGSIGSGKTTACDIFATFGATIVNSDKIAHRLMAPKSKIWQEIYAKFGNNIINSDQTINKQRLRLHCINDKNIKSWLELLMHPLIFEEINQVIKNSTNYYYIIEIPLLFEVKVNVPIHRTICVNTSRSKQIKRLKTRNNWSESEACNMIDLQMNKHHTAYLADDNIDNNSDIESLTLQIKQLHNFYKTLSLKTFIMS